MKYPYKILLIIISFLLLSLINAQDLQKIDSLEMIIEKTSGIEKVLL